MGDGKALQMGTSHELGQNFARALRHHLLQRVGRRSSTCGRPRGACRPGSSGRSSWATATTSACGSLRRWRRSRWWSSSSRTAPRSARRPTALVAELRAAGHRVRLDDRTDTSFGRRSVDWELKGVPVRVEVGPRDLAEGNVTVVTRHRREKQNVAARRRGGRRSAACWPRAGREPPGRGDRGPGGPHGRRRLARGGRRGGRRSASPGSGWGRSGPTARTAWPSTPSPSAACSGPTARWPSRATTRTISSPSSAGRISRRIAIIVSAVHF